MSKLAYGNGMSANFLIRKHQQVTFCNEISENRTAIMGLAMLSVMLFHQYFTSAIPFNAFHNFGNWGVDIFLFLSGMGLVQAINKYPLLPFYKRRFKRIIPSCILCGTTKYFAFMALGPSVIILKEPLHIGWWSVASLDLWFIPTIIILYIITPLLFHFLCNNTKTTFVCISIAFFINELFLKSTIGHNWISFQGIMANTIERLPAFMVGMLIALKKYSIDSKMKYSALFLFIAIGLRLLDKTSFSIHVLNRMYFYPLAIGLPALISICIYALRICPNNICKIFLFWGKYSLELYLVHEIIFWILKIKYEYINNWILLLIGFFISCLCALLCKKITNVVVN